MEYKTLTFVQEESAGSWLSAQNWLYPYIYYNIHEIFFTKFPIVLHEWLSILATRQTNFQRREAIEWNAQLIPELNSVSTPISRAVDFWVDGTLQGYIT